MAISVTTIRQRIATKLAEVSGWSEAPLAMEEFPNEFFKHLRYVVKVDATSVATPERKRVSDGVWCQSAVVVKWSYRIREDGVVADMDAASTAEHELIKKVLEASETDVDIQFDAARRRIFDQSLRVCTGELEFTARHRLALT